MSAGEWDNKVPRSKYSSAQIFVLILTGTRATKLTEALLNTLEGVVEPDLPIGIVASSSVAYTTASFAA